MWTFLFSVTTCSPMDTLAIKKINNMMELDSVCLNRKNTCLLGQQLATNNFNPLIPCLLCFIMGEMYVNLKDIKNKMSHTTVTLSNSNVLLSTKVSAC